MLRHALAALTFLALSCTAGAPPVPLQTVTVLAPFDRTWNAVIDVFTTSDLPIATIDKTSGLIAASAIGIRMDDGMNWADCAGFIAKPFATRGTFNIVVRPASAGTSVRVTASFSSEKGACASKGVFERWIQSRIKTAAEAAP